MSSVPDSYLNSESRDRIFLHHSNSVPASRSASNTPRSTSRMPRRFASFDPSTARPTSESGVRRPRSINSIRPVVSAEYLDAYCTPISSPVIPRYPPETEQNVGTSAATEPLVIPVDTTAAWPRSFNGAMSPMLLTVNLLGIRKGPVSPSPGSSMARSPGSSGSRTPRSSLKTPRSRTRSPSRRGQQANDHNSEPRWAT